MGYRYFLAIKSKTESLTHTAPNKPIPDSVNDSEFTEKQLEALHLATWRVLHAILRRAQSEDKTVEFVCWGIFDSETDEKLYVSDVLVEYVDAV